MDRNTFLGSVTVLYRIYDKLEVVLYLLRQFLDPKGYERPSVNVAGWKTPELNGGLVPWEHDRTIADFPATLDYRTANGNGPQDQPKW